MKARARLFDVSPVENDPIEIDNGINDLVRGLHKAARWSFFPYLWFGEADRSCVIVDRRYRLVCRKHATGAIEILPFVRVENEADENWISIVSQNRIYTDFSHPADDANSRQRVLGIVQRLGLKDEIVRRREIFHREWLMRRKFARSRCPR